MTLTPAGTWLRQPLLAPLQLWHRKLRLHSVPLAAVQIQSLASLTKPLQTNRHPNRAFYIRYYSAATTWNQSQSALTHLTVSLLLYSVSPKRIPRANPPFISSIWVLASVDAPSNLNLAVAIPIYPTSAPPFQSAQPRSCFRLSTHLPGSLHCCVRSFHSFDIIPCSLDQSCFGFLWPPFLRHLQSATSPDPSPYIDLALIAITL